MKVFCTALNTYYNYKAKPCTGNHLNNYTKKVIYCGI
jgi:hypothetical protein